jgi:hypothetical protein
VCQAVTWMKERAGWNLDEGEAGWNLDEGKGRLELG